ncbi:hypothetical protein DFA_10816 [Cavenderia fasciculata]|uniref:Uncharacterized protein n=1 Tax=Cavenderia fasciculata TaxID=261658 RepID=F4QBH0_CACFS|nr:uncharacterized protein DFA_10816 [Cavenderia fasciculata]EGG14942.1 hypothetical protein DFA_10816 [Cavenderia fasciculata]|eukprot:XP_004351458.1 hypothetical protein DFA_10816 [Cavenderia fasciculata]
MTTKLLANQLKGLMTDPVEGFTVELVNESSLFEWKLYKTLIISNKKMNKSSSQQLSSSTSSPIIYYYSPSIGCSTIPPSPPSTPIFTININGYSSNRDLILPGSYTPSPTPTTTPRDHFDMSISL